MISQKVFVFSTKNYSGKGGVVLFSGSCYITVVVHCQTQCSKSDMSDKSDMLCPCHVCYSPSLVFCVSKRLPQKRV